ncbi:hypothetical protein [Haloarchaeobius sp. HRN-SO-5]|uniref:hypothetical protein n=1 Tax=Haloarchaeobius sp. HRN-SO-5 TaxID=3446118 RepID=UPI003EC0DE81
MSPMVRLRKPNRRATMTLGDRVVAVVVIVFINAAFALYAPWLALLGLVASTPLAAAILFR